MPASAACLPASPEEGGEGGLVGQLVEEVLGGRHGRKPTKAVVRGCYN